MIESLRRYGMLLNSFYILELGDEPPGGEQLALPFPKSIQEAFTMAWHNR
jgi:hypothetical protein